MTPLIEGFDDSWKTEAPANSRDAIAMEFSDYSAPPIDISYADIAVAVYDQPPYEGKAFVLFRDTRDGQWYEVNASHCSCYGLEDQWTPEAINADELIARPCYVGYSFQEDEYKGVNDRIRDSVRRALEVPA